MMTRGKKLYYRRKEKGLCVQTGCKNNAQPNRVRCEIHAREAVIANKLKRWANDATI